MQPPLHDSNFTLDVSGIAGFLGGEEAISAMDSMPFYKHRKWLGWYNSPGSYTVAKHYGKLANSRLWDGLYPGTNEEPASFLGMDGKHGPKYRAVVSGTVLGNTGHIGYVFAQYCREDLKSRKSDLFAKHSQDTRRRTTPIMVTIAEFSDAQIMDDKDKGEIRLAYSAATSSYWDFAAAFVPISVSLGCCVVCALYSEWFSFFMILLGILSNGMACYVIGSAEIFLWHPKPSHFSPPADGLLDDRDQFIVLKGSEKAVNHVVKGKFLVKYGDGKDTSYNMIGFSATALTCQFLAQLFVIPQSGLFGQILFLVSLTVSWIYNAYLSSMDKDQLQQDILKENLPLEDWRALSKRKVEMPTRTSAVVFAMLCALPVTHMKRLSPEERAKRVGGILDSLLPKDTAVWDEWRRLILERVNRLLDLPLEQRLQSSNPSVERPDPLETFFGFAENDWGQTTFDQSQQNLLKDLLDDADGAYNEFFNMFLVGDWTLHESTGYLHV